MTLLVPDRVVPDRGQMVHPFHPHMSLTGDEHNVH